MNRQVVRVLARNELARRGYSEETIVARAEQRGLGLALMHTPVVRSSLGQFLSPAPIARSMASMFGAPPQCVRLLDAGAGIGILTTAIVERICGSANRPLSIAIDAYEVDPDLTPLLGATLGDCAAECQRTGVQFVEHVFTQDFIQAGTAFLREDGAAEQRPSYNCAILNPPYVKIKSDSEHRRLLHSVGIEASNLYAGFLALAARLLEPGGELVAITPRSFCNGPHFRRFRALFLGMMTLQHIHVFEARDKAFSADGILQETIVIHAIKGAKPNTVLISSSYGLDDEALRSHETSYGHIIRSEDPDLVVHIPLESVDSLRLRMGSVNHALKDINIGVSTGSVVDFRNREHLRMVPDTDSVPLIYPAHFGTGFIEWPKLGGKRPNSLAVSPETQRLILPKGYYVLVRRFSVKEQQRRVIAAIYDPERVDSPSVSFENHLNVYHDHKTGLPADLAKGLAMYLNSSLVDSFVRQFNGHTQVNATDLRMLPYPSRQLLEILGRQIGAKFPSQLEIDTLVEASLMS